MRLNRECVVGDLCHESQPGQLGKVVEIDVEIAQGSIEAMGRSGESRAEAGVEAIERGREEPQLGEVQGDAIAGAGGAGPSDSRGRLARSGSETAHRS
jgi:hypothetical protein